MPKTEPLGSSVMPLGKKTFASNKNFVDCQFISESEVPWPLKPCKYNSCPLISIYQFSVEAGVEYPPKLPEFKIPTIFQVFPTGTVCKEVISFASIFSLGYSITLI